MDNFYDKADGFFHYTSSRGEHLIARKKEIFDNVIPSSNGVMARNLLHLGLLLDRDDWRNKAKQMVDALKHLILSEPNYMSHWAIVQAEIAKGLAEVVIVGALAEEKRQELEAQYYPFLIVMGKTKDSTLPMLQDKLVGDQTLIHVCFNKTCKLPVDTVAEALLQL